MTAEDIYNINPVVDVYVIDNCQIDFFFITTRKRISMNVSPLVVDFISKIDGKTSIRLLCKELNISNNNSQLQQFIEYLLQKKILILICEHDDPCLCEYDLKRYDRQLNYLSSYENISPYESQKKIQDKCFVIFGVGAIGSGIAIQLVMSGARNIILIDKDCLQAKDIQRHFYLKTEDIGNPKVDALKMYLKDIDSKLNCKTIKQVIDYDSDISSIIPDNSFVINTLDEPYIGYTSLKIGRECFSRNIPLYVAGGFDAHLMSTGELIVPHLTPCVDCYISYFTQSLQNWKPKYNVEALDVQKTNGNEIFEVGGLSSMSLFAVSYAMIVILNYIVTENSAYTKGRGELLFDTMEIKYLNVPKNLQCNVCGEK